MQSGSETSNVTLRTIRPWKTILARTVADGGTSFYFRGDHALTIPTLWRRLVQRV